MYSGRESQDVPRNSGRSVFGTSVSGGIKNGADGDPARCYDDRGCTTDR